MRRESPEPCCPEPSDSSQLRRGQARFHRVSSKNTHFSDEPEIPIWNGEELVFRPGWQPGASKPDCNGQTNRGFVQVARKSTGYSEVHARVKLAAWLAPSLRYGSSAKPGGRKMSDRKLSHEFDGQAKLAGNWRDAHATLNIDGAGQMRLSAAHIYEAWGSNRRGV